MLFASDRLTADFLPEMNRFNPDSTTIRMIPERSWQIAGFTDNILTLDHCRYRVDGGQWLEADAIDVQTRLLDLERSCDLEQIVLNLKTSLPEILYSDNDLEKV